MSNSWNNSDSADPSPWRPPQPEGDAGPAKDTARDALFTQLGDQFAAQQAPMSPAPPDDVTVVSQRHAEIALFRQRLFHITPRTFVTLLIVLANAAVFVLMTIDSGELFSPNVQTLVEWGGNTGSKTLDGQWWRLITCMFVHVGIIHIGLNMWVLWGLGHLVERLVGNVGFFVMYFVAGIAGSVASVLWNPHVVSAGASGAVFGVFGALMGFVFLRRDSVPREIFQNLRNSGGMFLAYNLLFGLSVPGIDMAAHLGGLAAGAVCGVLMSQPLDRITAWRRTVRNVLTTVVAAGLLAIVAHFWLLPMSHYVVAWRGFFQVETQAVEAFEKARTQYNEQGMDDAEFIAAVESDVIAPWDEARREVVRLGTPPDRVQSQADLIIQYAEVRQQAWESLVVAIRDSDNEAMQRYQEHTQATERLLKEINGDG